MKRAIIMAAAFSVATLTGFAKEEKVKASDLPEAVVKAIKAAYPQGTIKEAEKETEDGKTVYEVDVVSGENKYELEIAEDGTIIKTAGKDDDDDDAKGEDDDGEKDDD